MASESSSPKSIALIHNTSLPKPLDILSATISDDEIRSCIRSGIPLTYEISLLDLADYDIDSSNQSRGEISSNLKSRQDWEEEIAKYSGFVLLFPYHIWSYCNPLKEAFSSTPLARKPILLVGFGKEEPFCLHDYNRSWQKKSFPMMDDFFSQKGAKIVGNEGRDWHDEGWKTVPRYPEFTIYANYWDDWITGGQHARLGGQQSEAFENRGWDRCQAGVIQMIDILEGRRKQPVR